MLILQYWTCKSFLKGSLQCFQVGIIKMGYYNFFLISICSLRKSHQNKAVFLIKLIIEEYIKDQNSATKRCNIKLSVQNLCLLSKCLSTIFIIF